MKTRFALIGFLSLVGTDAFTIPARPAASLRSAERRRLQSNGRSSGIAVAATIDAEGLTITTSRVETDEEVMEVASFRNNLESPEMMIARQQAKKDSIDPVSAAIKGVGIGLGIGAVAGIASFSSSGSIQEALQQFAVIGGVTAALLGANNLMGKSVYVMTLPEANNRLKVDFAEGLMARQDVGFVAKVEDLDIYGGRYRGSNGVVACVDCQLRNCDDSPNPRSYGSLPPHIHIKNALVDEKMRRRGIAKALVDAVEEYAKTTDAQMITLAVDNDNTAAINLYKNAGYDSEDISNPLSKQKYGTFFRGRSMMTKEV